MSDVRGALTCMFLGALMLLLLAFMVVSEAEGQSVTWCRQHVPRSGSLVLRSSAGETRQLFVYGEGNDDETHVQALPICEAEGQEKLHVDGVIDSQSSICAGGCMNKESVSKVDLSSAVAVADKEAAESFSTQLKDIAFPDSPQAQAAQVCHYEWSVPPDSTSGEKTGREVCHSANVKATWRDLRTEAYKKPGFWTVGRYDAPAPLRTNRELWRSKSFWLEELGLYGSTYAEVAISRSGRQNPPVPRGWDLDFDAFAPLPVITAMHVLARKYICQCIGDGAVLGATAWNLYSAGKQYYH